MFVLAGKLVRSVVVSPGILRGATSGVWTAAACCWPCVSDWLPAAIPCPMAGRVPVPCAPGIRL